MIDFLQAVLNISTSWNQCEYFFRLNRFTDVTSYSDKWLSVACHRTTDVERSIEVKSRLFKLGSRWPMDLKKFWNVLDIPHLSAEWMSQQVICINPTYLNKMPNLRNWVPKALTMPQLIPTLTGVHGFHSSYMIKYATSLDTVNRED